MYTTDVYKMYTKRMSHFSKLYMNFVFKFRRTMAAKFCIKSEGCILYAKTFCAFCVRQF